MNVPAAPGARITAAILGVVTLAWAISVWNAPIDATQGVIAKILFIHPPLAFGAYLGFVLTAVFSALYLMKGDDRWDRWAISSAEVGVLMCILMLLTGPIWARGTWGKWWTWDLRLTLTLLQFLIYVAYLLLRSFTVGNERTARFSAIYAIVGVVMIPLNYFAVEIANRSMHPDNLGEGSLGDGMGWPFLLGTVFVFAAFAYLVVRRYEVASLRDEHLRREVIAATREGGWAT